MYFLGNHGLSSECLSFIFRPAIIFILAGFIKNLIKCFLNYVIFSESFLKPSQNKKGLKNLGYPTKKQSFSLEKDCFFVGYPKFFGPSYFEMALVNSHNLLQKQLLNVFFGCKNRVCHHNFKLDAENNGWTKNEAKTFSRKSVISRKIHWLDNVRQSSS